MKRLKSFFKFLFGLILIVLLLAIIFSLSCLIVSGIAMLFNFSVGNIYELAKMTLKIWVAIFGVFLLSVVFWATGLFLIGRYIKVIQNFFLKGIKNQEVK